jgi:histidine triad (HIT) family protein
MSEVTIFDKILAGEIPANKVYEDDYVLAFHDVNPQAPTHVLVIPKLKFTGFSALKNQGEENVKIMGEYMSRISLVAEKLGLDDDGYRVVFNQGSDGGQTVEYIHAHIIGGRSLTWPPG